MGNNYTVTIASDELNTMDAITWKELQAAKYAFDRPFQLALADGQVLNVEKVVRIIPKRRMVVFGSWKDKLVVAKLFFDSKRARRNMEKEAAGIKSLIENKIPTPYLYYVGTAKDKHISVLLFERIFEAESLEDIWRNKLCVEDVVSKLCSMVIEIATQHVLGVLQHDLHLKNFLLTEKTIYTLDGGQIEVFPHLLSKKVSMNNLALFLSQLGVGVEELQEYLFKLYAKSRGWLLKPEDMHDFELMIKEWNSQRWQRYAKKIFRESTDFASIRDWCGMGVYERTYASPDFMQFLANPDAVFSHPTTKVLKAGRSSTVVRIVLDNRELVVKRYNLKSFWHRLRRCLRPSRAVKSWTLAQKLNLFHVRTAKPIAFLEKRYFGLRAKSYFVMEYISSEDAQKYFARHQADADKITFMVKRITQLLKNLAKLNITHGDLKMTNFMIDKHDQPTLIDLDGMREHLALSSLRSGWRKEIRRLLKNFNDKPALAEAFTKELSEN